jgi:hypothetical protein
MSKRGAWVRAWLVSGGAAAVSSAVAALPVFEYNSSDGLSQIDSIVSESGDGDALIAELEQCCVGFVSVEGTADSHGHSPTAVDGLDSAVRFVKKSQKKRTSAKNTIHGLHDRLNELEQGAKAASLKITNLEGRVKKIELDFSTCGN